MKKIYWILVVSLVGVFTACETKQDVWDTGVSSPYHDCSILEYMRGDDYNWELTVQMIERAGLEDLFEGQVDTMPEITFWGFPSYSVLRYLYDNRKDEVSELDPEECRRLVLLHVTKGKVLKEDIAYRDEEYYIFDEAQTGGTDLYTVGGCHLKAYVDKSDYSYVPDGGSETMFLYSVSGETYVPLASPNIQPLNGVVHALNYNYKLGDI